MDAAEREAFVSQPLTAIIATVDSKGRPHAVPIWYLYRHGAFEIFTDRDSAKARNARASGRAAIAIDTREGAFRHMTAEGPVEVQEQITREERFALHRHYRGDEAARKVVDSGDDHEDMVILRLRPERWY